MLPLTEEFLNSGSRWSCRGGSLIRRVARSDIQDNQQVPRFGCRQVLLCDSEGHRKNLQSR